jgi:hypothetical protein
MTEAATKLPVKADKESMALQTKQARKAEKKIAIKAA